MTGSRIRALVVAGAVGAAVLMVAAAPAVALADTGVSPRATAPRLADRAASRLPSKLLPGEKLMPGERLRSPNGEYDLAMQRDGNLVVYPAGQHTGALWDTHTYGNPGAYATFQKDGNFVLYPAGQHTGALWHSHTYGLGGRTLRIQDDSNLVVYAAHKRALWSWKTGSLFDQLFAGQTLTAGDRMSSPSRTIDLVMQGDGNLVMYNAGTNTNALWNSQTAGHPGAYAVMQGDGNLVIYEDGKALWYTETQGFTGSSLRLQDDKNLVVYHGHQPLWSRFEGELFDQLHPGWTLDPGDRLTSSNHAYDLVMQGDGNLVIYHSGQTTGALWDTHTYGHPGSHAVMQGDGNFVVYDASGAALWKSDTAGHSGVRLVMQSDGNLVTYQGGTALWSRTTGVISDQPPTSDAVVRAQSWVDSQVPYSQTTYFTNAYGTYRQDCSGYVSMAWQLGTSYTTYTLPQVSHPISKDQLQAGDALLNTSAHVVLFDRWANADHTSYWGYEEIDYGRVAEHRVIPYPYWSGYGTFVPYRKN